jgi:hypothetical protein
MNVGRTLKCNTCCSTIQITRVTIAVPALYPIDVKLWTWSRACFRTSQPQLFSTTRYSVLFLLNEWLVLVIEAYLAIVDQHEVCALSHR